MVNSFNDYCYATFAFNGATEKLMPIFIGSIEDKFNMYPCVVNCALTIELAFKALLIHQGYLPSEKSFQIHRLDKLFKKLMPIHQQEIQEKLKQRTPNLTEQEILDVLRQHSNYFVWLRYPDSLYGKHVDNRFIHSLRLACVQYIHDLLNQYKL